jgi:hypothetical protein
MEDYAKLKKDDEALEGRSRRSKLPSMPTPRTSAANAKLYKNAATRLRSKSAHSTLPCNKVSAASTNFTRASKPTCN